ncbi:flagellar M-ring protein FliF [Sphingomonas gilva]|uniref:Flagellar M-ring protein n=1 Tax=Sphingomonas gilva TaxID=2305907 RepID=A0A396RVH7_9SPHN|nr:flagellar basal-body MS-ring/collar protein FliF [Sphingomonas gilva]RHW18463.1 flagellar M-ring protein FliF [Sphingomonas gilva]
MSELVTIPAQSRLTMDKVRGLATQPAVTRALPMLGLLGVAGAAALAWSVISAPPQRALSTGMDDAEKAAVVDALASAGIANQVDRDTGAVTVAGDDYHRARMILAQQGLPKSAPDGAAVIDAMPMGASRAVEDQRLRAAREQDLARTIEAIDAVKTARVHLAFETPSVFVRDRSSPAASVMLRLEGGRRLREAQVGAIAHLVSSSVPGLDPAEVSIVDQNGRLLSRGGDGDPIAAASDRQLEVQERVEARYAGSIDALLTPIVGAGNFTAEVNADLDFAQVSATRENYPADQRVVAQERGETVSEPNSAEAGGIPGALANQPPPASQLSESPTSPDAAEPTPGTTPNRSSETYNRTFALGREVSVTQGATGTVKRLTVAVALKEGTAGRTMTPRRLAEIERLVKGAVGFDAARGDTVAVTVQPFVELAPAAPPPWYEAAWVTTLARALSGVIVALLLVFFIGRPLLKRHQAAAKLRAAEAGQRRKEIGTQMAGALAQQVRGGEAGSITVDMIESAPSYAARADLIRDFVRQDPARAALVVRDLLKAGGEQEARNA